MNISNSGDAPDSLGTCAWAEPLWRSFLSPATCNFPCCSLCLLPLPICCVPSRTACLHLLWNFLDSGRVQLGVPPGWADKLSCSLPPHCVLQPPEHPGGFLLDLLHFQCPSYTGQPQTGDTVSKALCKGEGSPALIHCAAPCTAQGAVGLLYCKVAPLPLVQVAVHQDFYSKTCLQVVGIHLWLLPGNVSLKTCCPYSLEFWASLGYLSLVSQKINVSIFLLDTL